VFQILFFLLSLFSVFYFSYRDDNFRLELKLQRLTEKYEWDEVIKEAEKAPEPTKTIAVYRTIALAHKNQLAERLFDFNYQYKPPASIYAEDGYQQFHYYSDLYFHASFLNVAYLWNMEFWVVTGSRFYFLKQMALYAILSGEKELASRYLHLLKQSLFYKKWAEEQERYINDPEILKENKVYSQIKHFIPKEDFIAPVNYLFPNFYLYLGWTSPENMERCMLACLYTKNLDRFISIMRSIGSKGELPACMQEGLLIYAIGMNDFAVLEKFNIDRKLKENVIHCVNVYKQYENNRELAEKKLKACKGTYCYFYFFSKTK